MPSIGEQIRSLRMQLGLSQKQLAGREMTRNFISLLENSRCGASPQTLRLIATRLGKARDYFFQDTTTGEEVTATVLIQAAQRSLAAGGLEAAQVEARQAVVHSQRTVRMDLEAEAQMLSGRAQTAAGSHLEAMECFEHALDCFRQLGNRAGVARAYFEYGNCAVSVEEYTAARRAYDKAIQFAEGIKTVQELAIRARLYLASTHFLLGQIEVATPMFRRCLQACDRAAYPELWADGAMGLGWVLYRQGHIKEAITWSKQAEAVFDKGNQRRLHEVRHNLAICYAATANWEEAYALLQKCLQGYKSLGLAAKQASCLEDLARYWLYRRDLDRGRAAIGQALDLLDLHDDGILRGRLYRLLADIEGRDQHLDKAEMYLRVSADLLRRLKATEELTQTLEHLRLLRAHAGPSVQDAGGPADGGALTC